MQQDEANSPAREWAVEYFDQVYKARIPYKELLSRNSHG
jgi:hypothetical protein